jgi:hypothetical protein
VTEQRRLEAVKELTAHSFSQARAYTNVVLAAGYAGLFGLWSTFKDALPQQAKLLCGLLIATSLALFLCWELLGMFVRHRMLAGMTRLLSAGDAFEGLLENHAAKERNLQIRVLILWPYFLWPTIVTGFGAFFVLLFSFVQRLLEGAGLIELLGKYEMSNWLAIAVGATIAVLMGLAFQKLTIRNQQRAYKKMYAAAITDDLNITSEIYIELKDAWQDNKTVLFSLIDEIASSRAIYDNDRANLYLMPNSELRSQVARYYRQSNSALSSLRRDQAKIYELETQPERIAKLVESIEVQFSRLDDLRLKAIELAGKTTSWA